MRLLTAIVLFASSVAGLTELQPPQNVPLTFPDAAESGSVTAGSVYVTDGGMVIATDLSASLYDFLGYVRPQYIRVYDGSTGESAYVMDTLGEGDNRWEPFATDGEYRSYYFATDGKIFCVNGRNGDKYWETDTGGTLLEPPRLSGDYIYAVSGHSFVGLSSSDGSELWRTWYRYPFDTPPAVAGNVVRAGAIDIIEKPLLKPYTKRRDAVYNGLTGDLIAGEYFIKGDTPRAAIFEHYYANKTLYVDITNPAVNFAAGMRSRFIFDYEDIVYIESADDEVAAYERLSGGRLWELNDYTIIDSAANAVLLHSTQNEPIYRCVSASGDDLWVIDKNDLVFYDFESEFALAASGGELQRLEWNGHPGWQVPGKAELFYAEDGSLFFYSDGHNLVTRDSSTGEKLWDIKLSISANYVEVVAGIPTIFNAFFIYALDPLTGGELWRIKNERSFATKNTNRDSPYVYAVSGDMLYVMHSNDVITAIDVTAGDVIWHRRYDFRTDRIGRTHCADGLLTVEGNDDYYYVVDMDDGSPVCKYRCDMMDDVWPRRQPAGFIVGADPYAMWYGFELPELDK